MKAENFDRNRQRAVDFLNMRPRVRQSVHLLFFVFRFSSLMAMPDGTTNIAKKFALLSAGPITLCL